MSEKIMVKVGGREYPTELDENGVQRFPVNRLFRHLFDSRMVDLNRLGSDYYRECFSQTEYLEFYMGLGYSVCGLAELSSFDNLAIENPLWDEK